MNSNSGKKRINKFDNIKGLAIFLIVLGHLCFLHGQYESIEFIRSTLFIFHLPLFFFVAGYFSKIDSDQPLKSFKRLIIPYILFNLIYALIYLPSRGFPSNFLMVPAYTLWFLIALFIMKLMLPIFDKLKYPLLFSIIIALLFGFIKYNGNVLGLRRATCFFPVFLLGFYFNDYKLKLENNYKKLNKIIQNKYFFIVISLLIIIATSLIVTSIPFKTIIMKSPYNGDYIFNMCIRMAIIALGIIGTLLILNKMTNKKCFLTKWGGNSMAIYLLHGYIVIALRLLLKPILSQQSELVGLFSTIIIALLVVTVLSSDHITHYYNKTIDCITNLIIDE